MAALFRRKEESPVPDKVEVERARYAYVVRTAEEDRLTQMHVEGVARLDSAARRAWLGGLAGAGVQVSAGDHAAGDDPAATVAAVLRGLADDRRPLVEAATEDLIAAVGRSRSASTAYEGFLDSPEAAGLNLEAGATGSGHRDAAYYSSAGNFGSRHRPGPPGS